MSLGVAEQAAETSGGRVGRSVARSLLRRTYVFVVLAVAVGAVGGYQEWHATTTSATALLALREEPVRPLPPEPLRSLLERSNGHWAAAPPGAVRKALDEIRSPPSLEVAARAAHVSVADLRKALAAEPVPTDAILLTVKGLARSREARDVLVARLGRWEQERLRRAILRLPPGTLPSGPSGRTYRAVQHASFVGYRLRLPPVLERYSSSEVNHSAESASIDGAVVGLAAASVLVALLLVLEHGYALAGEGGESTPSLSRARIERWRPVVARDLLLETRWLRGGVVLSPLVEVVSVVVALLCAGAAMSGGQSSFMPALAATAVVAFGIVGILAPGLFLLLLVFVRPLLDTFSERRLHIPHLPPVNLAGGVALALIVVTLFTLVDAGYKVRPVARRSLATVLGVSILAAAYAVATLHLGSQPIAEVLRLASLLAMYVLAATVVRTARGALLVLTCAGLSAVMPALVGLEQWYHGVPNAVDLTIGRLSGTFTGPVAFSMYLALGALVLVGRRTSLLSWRWGLPMLAIILLALIETYSRTGWLMFGLGAIVLAWQSRARLVLGLIVVGMVGTLAVPAVRDRALGTSVTKRIHHSGILPSSYSWRIQTWKGLLQTYSHKPLTGYGLMSTATVNPRKLVVNGVGHGYDAHNLAVKALVEGGPLLLLAYVWFFVSIIRRFWKLARVRWALATAANLLLVLWALLAFIGVSTDDPFAATALLLTLFAMSGAVEGIAVRSEVAA